jgi:hypothetical protein
VISLYVADLVHIVPQTSRSHPGASNYQLFALFRVKIMLPWDPQGKIGPKRPLPDHVSIVEPKDEVLPPSPYSEAKLQKPDAPIGAI